MSSQHKTKCSKADYLTKEGTLNVSAEKVSDPKFCDGEFFDPRDIVQVKYEMLRRVRVKNEAVTDAAAEYGFSRPAYYQAALNYDKSGIAGLVPKKRGPRGPHKVHSEVLAFLKRQVISGQPIRARKLAKLVLQEFGIEVHPRTIERAVVGKKKQ